MHNTTRRCISQMQWQSHDLCVAISKDNIESSKFKRLSTLHLNM